MTGNRDIRSSSINEQTGKQSYGNQQARGRQEGQLQHQRDPHGGRDAGIADHLHGHYAHVEQQGQRRPAEVIMDNANKEDAVTVAVTRDGRTYLGGDQVNIDDLSSKISAKLQNKAEGDKEVYLRADIRANYGKVMDTVDQIRAAGVSQLGLLTEKRDQDETAKK
jgi:biopolymer transport protein ExbD